MYKRIKLGYHNDSLEPFIDTHTVGLHYYKHYLSYLKKLNDIIIKNNYQFQYPLILLSYHLDEFSKDCYNDILFYLGGVLNHELYFNSISDMPSVPSGELDIAIRKQWGSLEKLLEDIKKCALNIKGSGYIFLVIDKDNSLKIMNTNNQDSPYFYGVIPLLGIDMWEHAYYINYENKRDIYLDNIFHILDFSVANDLYEQYVLKK